VKPLPAIEVAPPGPRHVQLRGPGGAVHLWLGGSSDPTSLEADCRAVTDVGQARSEAAVAFGDVARRHGLEVRVIPRVEAEASFLLVVFGKRTPRIRR
jgi:hypothetical protein